MSSNVAGFQNEDNLINYLNNKTYNQLNQNMKKFVKFIFPNIRKFDIIKAFPGKKGQKPDLEIIVNEISKKVSIKKGQGNSVHQEKVDLFIDFLISLNVNKDIIMELLKYHWSDGSTDGTGKVRISSNEYKRLNQNKIKIINKELNKPYILKKIVDRILFQGKSKEYDKAQYIYHGNIEEGKWASDIEIFNYIDKNSFETLNSVHFGPLTYQIWNSCLNYNPRTENRRSVMQSKWGSLFYDLEKIEQARDINE